MKASEERLPKCLTNEEEFQTWRGWNECEKRRILKWGNMWLCVTEEEEYMLWDTSTSMIGTRRRRSWMKSGGQTKRLEFEKKAIRKGMKIEW